MPWTTIADLGVGPANEDCAQLGRNPHFAAQSALELAIFQAAIIGLNGPPQPGLRYTTQEHRHDFGTYRTLVLQNDPERFNRELAHIYAERLTIPHSWIDAGFTPPIEASQRRALPTCTATQCIASAISITRPGADGTFYPLTNAVIHRALTAAYPEAANLNSTAKTDP